MLLKAGPLNNFAGSQTEHLRLLGLPVQLKNTVVQLLENYTVCKKGDILNPEQAKLLVSLYIKYSYLLYSYHIKYV